MGYNPTGVSIRLALVTSRLRHPEFVEGVVSVKFSKFSGLVSPEFISLSFLSLPRSSVGGVCSCRNALASQYELLLVLL